MIFPIKGSKTRTSVPWNLVEAYREQIEKRHGMKLERLAALGGIELDQLISDIAPESGLNGEDLIDSKIKTLMNGGLKVNHLGKLVAAFLVAASLLSPHKAEAQAIGGSAQLSATTVSSRVVLPAAVPPAVPSYSFLLIAPAPGTSVAVHYLLGGSSVTALTTSPAMPNGGICVAIGPNTYVAAITESGTATINLTQMSNCPNFSGGSGGGGSPTGAAGGDLAGTYPNPTLAWISHTGSQTLAIGAGGTLGAMAYSTDAANLTGTVACARLPALTGDVTTSAGSCVTSLAASIAGAKTFSTSVAIGAGSAITSSGPGGALGSNAYTSTAYLPLTGGTLTGLIGVNLNAASLMTPLAGTAIQVAGADGVTGRISIDSFGAIGALSCRRADGTGASPTAVQSGDQLCGLNAYTYVTTASAGYVGPVASYQTFATQNHTTAAQGSKAVIATTPNNSTTLTTAVTFDQDQSTTFAGNVNIPSHSLIESGAISSATWTTSGLRNKFAAASYTDTSSSGTVANAYTDLFGASTVLASSATTYTNYYGAYFQAPVASTNVTMTNKSALGADSISIGGAAQSTFALAITGTVNVSGGVTIGAASSMSGAFTFQNSILVRGGNGASRGVAIGVLGVADISMGSDIGLAWTSTTDPSGTRDTNVSRISAGITGFGTGAQGSIAGGIQAATVALGGATIGSDALAVTGNSTFASSVGIRSSNIYGRFQTIGEIYFTPNAANPTIGTQGTGSHMYAPADGSIQFLNNAETNSATISFPSATATPTFTHGALANATPVAQTIGCENASGTNIAAAATCTFRGPGATGTGTNGDWVVQTGVKVGSGTGSPTWTTALTIKGETQRILLGSNGTAGAPAIAFGSDTASGIWSVAAGNLSFSSNGAENMRLGSGGVLTVPNGFNIGGSQAAPQVAISSPATNNVLVTPINGSNGVRFGVSTTDGLLTLGTNAGGSGNALGSLNLTNLTGTGTADFTGPVRNSHGYTVATLPAAGTAGRRAYVTDQLTACVAAGVALTGGGAVTCPVFDNGTIWTGD